MAAREPAVEADEAAASTDAAETSGDRPTLWHPIYDVVGGASLLTMGVLLGGASWQTDADTLDIFFDVVGAAWLVAGAARWAARRAAPSPQKPSPQKPSPQK